MTAIFVPDPGRQAAESKYYLYYGRKERVCNVKKIKEKLKENAPATKRNFPALLLQLFSVG